jgi:hypothetical protein
MRITRVAEMGRARCVPDRRSLCGWSRSLTVRPPISPQEAESPGGRRAAL